MSFSINHSRSTVEQCIYPIYFNRALIAILQKAKNLCDRDMTISEFARTAIFDRTVNENLHHLLQISNGEITFRNSQRSDIKYLKASCDRFGSKFEFSYALNLKNREMVSGKINCL